MSRPKAPGLTKSDVRKRRARRVVSDRMKRWRRRALLLLALILAAGAALYAGLPDRAFYGVRRAWYRTTASDGLVIRNLYVEGRRNIDPAELRSVIGVKVGDPLLGVDPQDEAAALKRLAWVKDVRVERRLPDTLFIRITERQPLALWQDHGKLRLIDEDGVVLGDAKLQNFSILPLIVGDDAPAHATDLFKQLATAPAINTQLDSAVWLPGARWDVRLKNHQLIQLPAADIAATLQELAEPAGRAALADKSVTLIDLREPGRIAVRTASPQ